MMLSNIVLNANPIDLDTIIIHELTHCLIDSHNAHNVSDYYDFKELGKSIYDLTDENYEYKTRHTVEFCEVLAIGCLKYTHKTRNFKDGVTCMKSAMRFDIFED